MKMKFLLVATTQLLQQYNRENDDVYACPEYAPTESHCAGSVKSLETSCEG